MSNVEITAAVVRFAAMNLLSMREHSVAELYKKLEKKYQRHELIVSAINRLAEEGLQSDTRFAEAFVTMRKRQGKGPLLINVELKERGVSAELIKNFLDADDESWRFLASVVRQKKFGETLPRDAKEKAKQMRFLAARGFGSACIQYALKYPIASDEQLDMAK